MNDAASKAATPTASRKPPAPRKLCGDVWTCELPTSLGERHDLYTAYTATTEASERYRVFAAALALCWPLLRGHLAVNGFKYNGKVVEYGGAAQDALLGDKDNPVPHADMIAAGRDAMQAVRDSLFPVAEASKDPAGFSSDSPPPGGSSGETSGDASGSTGSLSGTSGSSTPT